MNGRLGGGSTRPGSPRRSTTSWRSWRRWPSRWGAARSCGSARLRAPGSDRRSGTSSAAWWARRWSASRRSRRPRSASRSSPSRSSAAPRWARCPSTRPGSGRRGGGRSRRRGSRACMLAVLATAVSALGAHGEFEPVLLGLALAVGVRAGAPVGGERAAGARERRAVPGLGGERPVGLAILAVVAASRWRCRTPDALPSNPLLYVGGLCGAFVVVVGAAAVQTLGVLRLGLARRGGADAGGAGDRPRRARGGREGDGGDGGRGPAHARGGLGQRSGGRGGRRAACAGEPAGLGSAARARAGSTRRGGCGPVPA